MAGLRHPFETWPATGRGPWTWTITGSFVALGLCLYVIGLSLPEGGLLGLELATDHDRVEEILAAWRADGVVGLGAFSLGLDMAYLVAYGLFFAVAGSAVASRARARGALRLASAAAVAAWLALPAALLDLLENVFQIPYFDDPRGGVPMGAAVSAGLKFALLIVIVLVLAIGAVLNRRSAAPAEAD